MPNVNRYWNGSARRKLRARLRRSGIEHCQNPRCGCLLDWDHPYQPNSAELDEVIPVSKLPPELRKRACIDPRNVQVLCRRCNLAKRDKLGWAGTDRPAPKSEPGGVKRLMEY